jgi:sugar lactone lactonase YvrE
MKQMRMVFGRIKSISPVFMGRLPSVLVPLVFLLVMGSVASASTAVLVADTLNNAVRAYSVNGTNWVYTGIFAAGDYGGQPLALPQGLAQDANGIIYVSEATSAGRVMCFDTNANYLRNIGTNGIQFLGGVPQFMAIGADGNLYLTYAFGTTASNAVWKYTFTSGTWSIFVPNTGAGYALNNPRGLAFGPDDNLYVADRGNNAIRKFDGGTGVFLGNLVSRPQPQAISWDTESNAFLVSRTFYGVIESIALNGAITDVYTQSTVDSFLDVKRVEGSVAFTRYNSDRVDMVSGPGSTAPLVLGVNGPGGLLVASLPERMPDCPALPGAVIDFSPKTSQIFFGSPALAILSNGDYLTSHELIGSDSSEDTLGQTFLFRSSDRGTNWSYLGQINEMVSGSADDDGCYYNHFLQINGSLYSMGNKSKIGEMVIRHGENDGTLWSYVGGLLDDTGRLFGAQSWRPGQTYVLKDGNVWLEADRDRSATFGDTDVRAIFAPTNSDLLDPSNWSLSTGVTRNVNWLSNTFVGWQEGNMISDKFGGMVMVLRVINRYPNGAGIGGKAAIVRVNYAGGTNATTTFSGGNFDPGDPNSSGFVDFPGGITRFTIRFDPVSQKYWTLCNYIPRRYRNDAYDAERFRGILALASSPDLKDWNVERIIIADWRIYSDDPVAMASAFNGNQGRFGFQFADWQFDGPDIVATVRTAFCDNYSDPSIGLDANYDLFKRIEKFRTNADDLRISDLQMDPGSHNVRVVFASFPARMYRIQSSTDLIHWEDAGQSLEGNGNPRSFTVINQISSSCFYRITEGMSWIP